MPYPLLFHPDISRKDLPRIPRNVQSRIADALALRLGGSPEKYGQPLRGTLGGYWKLRVGDYRVVFKIVSDEDGSSPSCTGDRCTRTSRAE